MHHTDPVLSLAVDNISKIDKVDCERLSSLWTGLLITLKTKTVRLTGTSVHKMCRKSGEWPEAGEPFLAIVV